MPDGKPTKAPLIVFGGVLGISIICVSIVLVGHLRRSEPYLDTKMRRVRRVQQAEAQPKPAIPIVRPEPVATRPASDAGSGDAGSGDAGSGDAAAEETAPEETRH